MREIDFTPQWYLSAVDRRAVRSRMRRWVAVLLITMALWTIWQEGRIASARAELGTLREAHAKQATVVARTMSFEREAETKKKFEAMNLDLAGGARMHRVLAEIAARLPTSTYLSRLSVTRGDRVEASVVLVSGRETGDDRLAGLNVALEGHALSPRDVGRFVHALTESPVFQSVQLRYSRPMEIGGIGVQEFGIRCRLPEFR